MMRSVPTRRIQLSRILIDVIGFLILAYPMVHIYVFLKGEKDPNVRGFFCDDESLKHPMRPETLTTIECLAVWAIIVIVILFTVEVFHFLIFKPWPQGTEEVSTVFSFFVVELYRLFGYFCLGAMFTLLMTEMAKFMVGRLRPYFLTICNADLTDELCKDNFGYAKFVSDVKCDENADAKELREARKSFLSGHSSFSFYCAVFLVLYLQSRLTGYSSGNAFGEKTRALWVRHAFRFVRIFRPFFQFGLLALAFYVAITRVQDYRHHATDVLAGAVLGIIVACLVMRALVRLAERPRIFHTARIELLSPTEIENDHNFQCNDNIVGQKP